MAADASVWQQHAETNWLVARRVVLESWLRPMGPKIYLNSHEMTNDGLTEC